MKTMIVAEVSKTWRGEEGPETEDTIGSRFAIVIQTNANRGFGLHSWRYGKVFAKGAIYETIVAVFQKEGK